MGGASDPFQLFCPSAYNTRVLINLYSNRLSSFSLLLSSCSLRRMTAPAYLATTTHFSWLSSISLSILSSAISSPMSMLHILLWLARASHSNKVCAMSSVWLLQNQHAAQPPFPNLIKYDAKHPWLVRTWVRWKSTVPCNLLYQALTSGTSRVSIYPCLLHPTCLTMITEDNL